MTILAASGRGPPHHIPTEPRMSETTTEPTTDIALDPFGILMTLVIALLTPMFFSVSGGNIRFARLAAVETVDAYRARSHADLIAVAQTVAFGLAALGSLSLSMADDISVSMALRLRGNANACNRSAQQNRQALAKTRPHAQQSQPMAAAEVPSGPAEETMHPEPDVFLNPAAAQVLAEESRTRLGTTNSLPVPPPAQPQSPTRKRHQRMWAIAMAKQAGEITANLRNLPPAERKGATMRAAALGSTAHNLMYGGPAQPLQPGALDHITRSGAGAKQKLSPAPPA
ncbi:MAG: hypothetical protein QOF90_781 [Acetobacteraceae bacterium]|nr:hypothetical protein [Acetobacteraceae bacterium]